MRTNHATFPAAEVAPKSILAPLELREIFGRAASLEIDLGCGDGTFLVSLAQENPARDFLGIERLAGRARTTARQIGQTRLTNARILRFDILHAIRQLLPPRSVAVFHLLFPDPWPKRRHWNRRIVSEEFLRAAARALAPEGELRIATDHADYFAEIERIAAAVPQFELRRDSISPFSATTTFEARFRERGAQIYRLSLRKISDRK